MRRLLIATHNEGKVVEYRDLLSDLPLHLTYLGDLAIHDVVEETEDTFEGNALLKARYYAKRSGLWTWADDSGLEVDVLDGRPGVLSARYGGPGLSDEERYLYLLAEMSEFPHDSWTARFRCVVAIVQPDGKASTVSDSVEGLITDSPRGTFGFGYDPIFYLPDFDATMAELHPGVKNNISHRGKAAAAAKLALARMLTRAEGNEE